MRLCRLAADCADMPAEALAKVYFRDDADWRDDNEEISQIFVSESS